MSSWVLFPKSTARARVRLFCFPYAGGGASVYRAWANDLGADIAVCPVQLPGRGNRLSEPPCTRLSRLVDVLADVLLPQLGTSFALFGHSMGALIGFELARELWRRRGVEPVHLFVSSHRAPQLAPRESPIHQLPADAFIARLRRLNGTPPEVLGNAELMELALPILRADFELCETYVFRATEPLRCPISAFGGLSDADVSRDELVAWQSQTEGPFSVRMFTGDHFFLSDSCPPLLRAMSQDLARGLAI
jgi:medium-chain acyl-[acyl-carrier-protein] hydrolase